MDFYPARGITQAVGHPSLESLIKDVADGRWAKTIARHREQIPFSSKEAERKAKGRLPGVTPSINGAAKRDEWGKHTGLVVIDYDDLERPHEFIWSLGQLRPDRAPMRGLLAAAFVSPGGEGVKAFFRVSPVPKSPEEHHAAFARVVEAFAPLGVAPDMGMGQGNPGRLCFVSHDPDAVFDPDAWSLTAGLATHWRDHRRRCADCGEWFGYLELAPSPVCGACSCARALAARGR